MSGLHKTRAVVREEPVETVTEVLRAVPGRPPQRLAGGPIYLRGKERVTLLSRRAITVGKAAGILSMEDIERVLYRPFDCPENVPVLVVYYQRSGDPADTPTHAVIVFKDATAVHAAFEASADFNAQVGTEGRDPLFVQRFDMARLKQVGCLQEAITLAGFDMIPGPFPHPSTKEEKALVRRHLTACLFVRREMVAARKKLEEAASTYGSLRYTIREIAHEADCVTQQSQMLRLGAMMLGIVERRMTTSQGAMMLGIVERRMTTSQEEKEVEDELFMHD